MALDVALNALHSSPSGSAIETQTQIDPARFTDKAFTRKLAFKGSVNDYRILVDGLGAMGFMGWRRKRKALTA